MLFISLWSLLSLYGLTSASDVTPGGDIQLEVSYELVNSGPHGGQLFNIIAETTYTRVPQLLNLTGTPYEHGFDTAYLVGDQIVENYEFLLEYLFGADYSEIMALAFNSFCDWQWNNYLGVQVPEYYNEEFRGLEEGGHKAGFKQNFGRLITRVTVVANFPGNLENLILIFQDEMAYPPNRENSCERVELL